MLALACLQALPGWAQSEAPPSGEPGSAERAAPAHLPGRLEVRSESSAERVGAQVYGTLGFPYEAVVAALADPASWCGFLALHLNTKACVHGSADGAPLLILYSGRKYYEAPEDAYRLEYRFQSGRDPDGALRVALRAPQGPLGTRDHWIEVRAAPAPEGTAIRVRCSFAPSVLSRAGTSLYLATLGRGKEGFSRVLDPESGEREPVVGVRGIIERNAVRYFLALDAFLRTRPVPAEERFEARLRTWFDLTAPYPQLQEVEREAYLDAKRRERANQTSLQRTLEDRGLQSLPGGP